MILLFLEISLWKIRKEIGFDGCPKVVLVGNHILSFQICGYWFGSDWSWFGRIWSWKTQFDKFQDFYVATGLYKEGSGLFYRDRFWKICHFLPFSYSLENLHYFSFLFHLILIVEYLGWLYFRLYANLVNLCIYLRFLEILGE